MERIVPHNHDGTSLDKLFAGDSLRGAPQESLTTASVLTVNSGDADTNTVINNTRTRLNELETKLRTLGILK